MKSNTHGHQLIASAAIASLLETIATKTNWEVPCETLLAVGTIAANTRFADDSEVQHVLELFDSTAEHVGALYTSHIAEVHRQMVAMSIGHQAKLVPLHESAMNFMGSINEDSMLAAVHFRSALMVLELFEIPSDDLEIVYDTCQTTAELLGCTDKKWFRGAMIGLQHRIDAHAADRKTKTTTHHSGQKSPDVGVAAD